MNVNRFNNSDFPYEELEDFGLTRNMIEDLPMDVLENILNGQRSPVLPMVKTTSDGDKLKFKGKFSLKMNDDGKTEINFHPVVTQKEDGMYMTITNETTGEIIEKPVPQKQTYSKETMQLLNEGKAVLDFTTGSDGRHIKAFLQKDPETNEILAIPSGVIGRNLHLIMNEFNLNEAEANCIQNGNILTIEYEDEPISIGIDLNHTFGIRMQHGSEAKWKEKRTREWNKYTVGVFGCWVMDEDGLDYVPEESYSEEMWEEIERQRYNKKGSQQGVKY